MKKYSYLLLIFLSETYMLTISTVKRNETDKTISKSIAVTRQPKGFTSETVYYDNLDKAIWSGSGNPFIDQWDGYINATGTGAENIEYTGRTVSVRNNFQSSGYAGASRKNAFYFGGKDAYVTVNNIQLQPGQTSFSSLSDVVNSKATSIHLPISKYISAETEVR